MKIYLKSGRVIRVSRTTGENIAKEIAQGKKEVVWREAEGNTIFELYRLDEVAAVR